MDPQVVGHPCDDIGHLAEDLLQQAERCALAGLHDQSAAILTQVWTIAQIDAPAIANRAAWDLAWLLLRSEMFVQATDWFSRITAVPTGTGQFWPIIQQAAIRSCTILADQTTPAADSRASRTPQTRARRTTATSDLPPIHIFGLGRWQIVRDGAQLPESPARKAIGVLRYILTQHHWTARKEELMEVLWRDARPEQAAHSLHVAVNTLRRYLNPPIGSYLLFVGGNYLIDPDAPVEYDCTTFLRLCDAADEAWNHSDRALAQASYSSAIRHYQNDYFVDVNDLVWVFAERERLLARYLTALDRVGRIFIAQRSFEMAIEYYHRLLERDPYREDAHYQVIWCYSQLGRRGDAWRQYQRCATVLANDLGLEPTSDLQQLIQALVASTSTTDLQDRCGPMEEIPKMPYSI